MNHNTPLDVSDLAVAYQKKPVLYDVSFSVPPAQLVGIIGPNGAGKSSLIKAIMGLIPIISGHIRIFGLPLHKALKHIGYVPQRESIDWNFPVNVQDVVLMGRYNHIGLIKRPKKQDHDIVLHSLERVQMLPFKDRQISELSGGQQQRVFLARALAQNADIYFMDEPFAGVDATTEQAIIQVLTELKSQGKTLLIVHHDLATAQHYFDHVLLLNQQVIAFGDTPSTFTIDNLQKTYEGKLNIFSPNHKNIFIAQQDDPEK